MAPASFDPSKGTMPAPRSSAKVAELSYRTGKPSDNYPSKLLIVDNDDHLDSRDKQMRELKDYLEGSDVDIDLNIGARNLRSNKSTLSTTLSPLPRRSHNAPTDLNSKRRTRDELSDEAHSKQSSVETRKL